MDISDVILKKMQDVYYPLKCPTFECKGLLLHKSKYIDIPMDATNMQFRDNSFEFAIDKGTYDALAVKFNRKQ